MKSARPAKNQKAKLVVAPEGTDLGPAFLLLGVMDEGSGVERPPVRELDPRSATPRARAKYPTKLHFYHGQGTLDLEQLRAGLRYAKAYASARQAPRTTADYERVGNRGRQDTGMTPRQIEAESELRHAEGFVSPQYLDVLITVAWLDEYAGGEVRTRMLRKALAQLVTLWSV